MISGFYQFLASIGYEHPLHPALAHLPVGLTIGAFLFALGSMFFAKAGLAQAARWSTILALASAFPTIAVGYMEWQHFYAGAPIPAITIKTVLALILIGILIAAAVAQLWGQTGNNAESSTAGWPSTAILAVGVILVAGIGFHGGELVYGSGEQHEETAALEPTSGSGETAKPITPPASFEANCVACHRNGGNTLKAQFPLAKAPQLEDFEQFRQYLRTPKARDGSATIMPPYPESVIPDAQLQEIYDYLHQRYRAGK